jgi:hypothetical protein
VQHEPKERWIELCEQAANELDTQKLMGLVEEITRLLDERDGKRRVRETQMFVVRPTDDQ